MKNKNILRPACLILIAGLWLQGCSFLAAPTSTPTFTPSATFTPTATFTVTSTNTPAPTDTPSPTSAPTPTPTPECGVADSSWASREQTDLFGGNSPLLTFRVSGCEITNIEIAAYPAPGELFWSPYDGLHIAILDQTFHASIEDPELGTFTLAGKFLSATACQGTIEFPKGFLVFDYVLPAPVMLTWNAAPA